MNNEQEVLTVGYHSGSRLGKTQMQAEDLARRVQDIKRIEIVCYPAPELRELKKYREALEVIASPLLGDYGWAAEVARKALKTDAI